MKKLQVKSLKLKVKENFKIIMTLLIKSFLTSLCQREGIPSLKKRGEGRFSGKCQFESKNLLLILISILALIVPSLAFADWTLPVSINSGTAKTNLTIGVSSGATNGYDQGLDSPTPFEGESLNAYFPHPDWGVVVAGTSVDKFHRDIRGGIPQDFYFEILSTVTPVTIKWDTVGMPEKTTFMLYDHTTGIWIDMRENVTYTFNPSANPNGFTVKVTWGDLTPPSSPTGLGVEDKVSSFFITWDPNTEGDLAGYKIHFGKKSETYERTVDIKDVNNYSLLNLSAGTVYYIALTAYDKAGNESPYSMEVSGKPAKPIVALSVSESGTGSGTVTSSPSGIICGTDCSETYNYSTSVTLTATPDASSSFSGWSGGDCSGTGTCTITMSADTSVTATFAIKTYAITASTGSGGSISPSGTVTVNYGSSQTFTITPNSNYSISGVIVDGTSVGAVLSYTFSNVTANHTISVSFQYNPPSYSLTITKSGTGSGMVTGSGISCGTDCSETYSEGTSVTLTPTASAGSTFGGWSGACSGTGTCVVTMNTTRTVTATFNLTTAPPDLRVSSLTAPTSGGAGTTISVTETTRNNGRGSAGASTTSFYLSTNSTLDAGDTLLGSRAIPALAGGASSSGTTSVTIPSGTSTGRYYIIAKADDGNVVTETNEGNNTRNRTITIVGPDLRVSSLTAPTTGGAGTTISVTETTRNNGRGSAGASTTRFYLSKNRTLDAGDALLGSRAIPALAGGASSTGTTSVTIPSGTSTGRYYIIAKADGHNAITETNENNNTCYRTIKIGT